MTLRKKVAAGGKEGIDELLTVGEVASRLRVDDTTVRRWIKNGVLEAITLPHHGERQAYRIRESQLRKILKESHDESSPA